MAKSIGQRVAASRARNKAGRERLKKKLEALSVEARTEVRKALGEAAEGIRDTARNFVPKDTGNLEESIQWQYGNEKRIAYSQGVGGDRSELSARVSAGDFVTRYAHLVEFGTAPHPQGGQFEGTMHPGTKAQPFFFPAYRANKKKAVSRVRRAVRKSIKKAVT